ncbi:MAG TPA: hypothetical protein VFW71_00550 [Actinomycetota bacterium]|nr:hypothetical protein [Actinomycetota bacterium]
MSAQPRIQPVRPSDGARPAARARFRSPAEARGYAPLDPVFEDTELDLSVRFTYFILKQHAWSAPGTDLGTDEIARLLGRSTGQAYRNLLALVDAGLLSIDARAPDGQPDTFILEPLEERYRERPPGPEAKGNRPIPFRRRPGTDDNRGAVLPLMTPERRAYEERLAAGLPPGVPAKPIDPHLRELGLARSRALRRQLQQPNS